MENDIKNIAGFLKIRTKAKLFKLRDLICWKCFIGKKQTENIIFISHSLGPLTSLKFPCFNLKIIPFHHVRNNNNYLREIKGKLFALRWEHSLNSNEM